MEYTVGELARRSGLTVRALHHYEQLGLLQPSGRTEAGYRLYNGADVQVLHHILAYRQMGMPLKEIASLLGPNAPSLASVLARQQAMIEEQLVRQQQLLQRLQRVATRLAQCGEDLSEELLEAMSLAQLVERYFSHEQLNSVRALQDELGPERLADLKTRIAALLGEWRAAAVSGRTPDDAEVQALARRWRALENELPTDPAMGERAQAMLREQPALREAVGLSLAELDFLNSAVKVAREAQP